MVEQKGIFERRSHEGREDLAGEHALNDLIQVILLIIFLAVWGIDSFWLKLTTFPGYAPLFLRSLIGTLLLLFSFYLSRNGLKIIFGQERAKPEVVRHGPFSRVRHPIYLAAILLYLGLTVFTFSLASLIMCVIIIIYYDFAARHEEKLLLTKYGDDYKKYMAEVPRWIPRLRS